MVEFSPSEEKVAKIPMSNPTTKPFDYTVELYMGTNLALMASTDFHLEAGESKDIELPVTMPSVIGTYPVYIGVFSAGEFIEPLYKAVEDVVIFGVAEFAYVSAIRQTRYETAPGYAWSSHKLKVEIDIKNTGNVAEVCSARPQMACAEGGWTWQDVTGNYRTEIPAADVPAVLEVILQPGETVTFWGTVLDSVYYGYTCRVRFTGDPGTTPEVPMV